MLLNHYDRIKCLSDNDLPLFGFAGVERLGYYTLSPAKVHEVRSITLVLKI